MKTSVVDFFQLIPKKIHHLQVLALVVDEVENAVACEKASLEEYERLEDEINNEGESVFYTIEAEENNDTEATRLEKALNEFKESLKLTVVGYNRLVRSIIIYLLHRAIFTCLASPFSPSVPAMTFF